MKGTFIKMTASTVNPQDPGRAGYSPLSLTALCQGSVTDETALGLRHHHTFPAHTEDGNWFAWMGKPRIFIKFGTWAGSLLPAETWHM